jgi:hypothetical protein
MLSPVNIRRIAITAAVLAAVATPLATGVASATPGAYHAATAYGPTQPAAEQNAYQALLNQGHSYCGQPSYSDALTGNLWRSTATAYCIG